jgi:hypothetical protein
MLIEPALLVMHHSLRDRAELTGQLLSFLCAMADEQVDTISVTPPSASPFFLLQPHSCPHLIVV